MGSVSSATAIVLLLFLSCCLLFSSSSSTSPLVSKTEKSQLLGKSSLIDAEIDEKSTQKLKKKSILAAKNQTKLLKPKKSNSTTDADAAVSKVPKVAKDKVIIASTADADAISKVTKITKDKVKKAAGAADDDSSKVTDSTKLKPSKSLTTANQKASNSTKLLKSATKSNSTKLSKFTTKSSSDSTSSVISAKSSGKSDLDAPPAKKKAADGSSGTKTKSDLVKPPAKKKAGDGSSGAKVKSDLDAPPAKKKGVNGSTAAKLQPVTAAKAKNTAKPGRSTAWMEEPDDSGTDLISDFRELPSRLLPDLERLSTTSKAYISAANRGIAAGVQPYVGRSAAPRVAPVLSSLFLALPLALLALLFRRLRAYLSLRLLLVFIQAYLAIYFATLAATALLTGLEPLRFFYATSPASYAWTQAAQTMGYLVYLVAQLADLVAVFAGGKEEALGGGGGGKEVSAAAAARGLALAQMVIGLGVGAHYYVVVFHRAVAGEPPRANWRVHAAYAACFVVICACARAERRKKVYEGGEDGKIN